MGDGMLERIWEMGHGRQEIGCGRWDVEDRMGDRMLEMG
jgi:hypothetical protein